MPYGMDFTQQDFLGTFRLTDNTTGNVSLSSGDPYSGPVTGLEWQLGYDGSDNINIRSLRPNSFIHTGSGNDAIDVSPVGGNNVLDGGSGSNFLTGGQASQGKDQFYLDDRNPAAVTWSTLVNFHAGDGATVWGVTPQDFKLTWLDNQGATGYTGLTAVFEKAGVPESGLTLAGFTSADLGNGKLSMSWGATQTANGVAGSTYMHIDAH